jgi:hypothetical protein
MSKTCFSLKSLPLAKRTQEPRDQLAGRIMIRRYELKNGELRLRLQPALYPSKRSAPV